MPQPHRVRFDENGKRCPKNIQKLRRLPECGIFDRDLLPFNPVNPPAPPAPDPDHPFQPYDMSGIPGVLNDRLIPDQPERPTPEFPPETGTLVGGATGPGSQYTAPRLPQDDTNALYRGSGRVLHEESRFGLRPTFYGPRGYRTVPVALQGGDSLARPLQPANYRNESDDRVIQDLDDIINSVPRRTDVELADLSAVVDREVRSAMLETADDGAGAIPRPRRMPIGDPRDTEFASPERVTPRRFKRPSVRLTPQLTPQTPPIPEEVELTSMRQRPPAARRLGMRNVVDSPAAVVGDQRLAITPQKRRGDYFELEGDEGLSEKRYRVRVPRERTMSQVEQRSTQLRRNLDLARQSAERMRASIAENISSRTRGAIDDIRASTVRQFGQGYERVVADTQEIRVAQAVSGERPMGGGRPITGDIEMGLVGTRVATTDTGDLTIRRPVTEEITGLRDIDLDFSPLNEVIDEPTVIGRAAPELSFSDRIGAARTSFKEVNVRNAAGASGAAGVGFLAGMGVAQLMGGTDYTHNKFANASIVGATAGASGDVFGRTAAAIGTRTFGRSAGTVAAETAAYTAARASTAVLRGAGEGLVIGAAAAPLDLLLNDALMKSGNFSHAGANVTSSAVVGLGTVATIGAISLAAAPETLGLSLVVGGLATVGSMIFGGFMGADQDRKEKEARRKQEDARRQVTSTADARRQLLATLPQHGYDFNQALAAFPDQESLGVNDDTWRAFSSSSQQLFVARPSNSPAPPPGGNAASGEQKKMNDLFSKYITHTLIERVCTGGTDCSELRNRDPGDLTQDERNFLNDKTGETWQPQADMQVEMSVQELQYTGERISTSKKAMIDAWNKDQSMPEQMDSYLVQTAYLDTKFEDQFNTAIKFDAQDRVIDAYATSQTKMEQLPPNIQRAAGLDPDFSVAMHAYYNDMENTASSLEVTVPQLIELQGLEGEVQRTRYQEMQFDRIKTQTDVVQSAGHLATEEDAVRAAGFYDLDQAFLETDPTDISSWNPSDSQILQAHAAGMNLNQYVAYIHQLALGEDGDFKKLPTYTEDQLRQYGLTDRDHFYDELAMAYGEGSGPQMYDYNPDTRLFTPKQGVHLLPNHNEASQFISKYTPAYLLRARKEYADMIHGLNEKNQAQVDQYNTRLLQELTSYGDQYDEMVGAQNEYLLSHAGPTTHLLHYNVRDAFDKYRIEYNPLSDALPTHERQVVGTNPVSAPNLPGRGLQSEKQKQNERAASKYGLSVGEYHKLKHNIQEKGLVNASEQQVASEVASIKSKAPAQSPSGQSSG